MQHPTSPVDDGDMVDLELPPDPYLDKLMQTAAKICNTPIALVSLVGDESQFFVAKTGIDCSGTSRDVAFCAYTIEQDDIFVINNAALDDRFKNNPLVTGSPFIRFYAGIPIKDRVKRRVGSVCIIDQIPQALTNTQMSHLKQLKLLVEARLFQRRAA